MNWFFDMIDLGTNLKRALQAIRSVTGLPALVLAIALTILCVALAPLIWHFDINSTLTWTDRAVTYIIPTLPLELVAYGQIVAISITILPTLVELFTARFAIAGIAAFKGIIYACALFDGITDYPHVDAFLTEFQPQIDQLGLLAGPTWLVARIAWLFMATFGFEVVFVLCAVCALVLFINVGASNRTMEGRHVR